jgi:hypothetical protein
VSSREPLFDSIGVGCIPQLAIDPEWRWYRYLLAPGGRIIDVRSPYRADSNDRTAVLAEAHRLWGGKKDDWKIEGVSQLDRDDG